MNPWHGDKNKVTETVIIKADFLAYCKTFSLVLQLPVFFLVARNVFHEQNHLNPCCARLISLASFDKKNNSDYFSDWFTFLHVKILKQPKKS